MTARPGEQRGISPFERFLEKREVQSLLQVVDFSGSSAPALALAVFA